MQAWKLDEKQTVPCPKCGNKLITGFEMICHKCHTTFHWSIIKGMVDPILVEKKNGHF